MNRGRNRDSNSNKDSKATDMKNRGVVYYPEYWPRSRWARDAQLMAEAGLNTVRLGDFAWARMEPRDGDFQFEWLDQAIAELAARGIGVILATPTAGPPVWLIQDHPDVMRIESNSERARFGFRRDVCPTSEIFQTYALRIATQLFKAFGKHEAILGWQIDNEPSSLAPCYCDRCIQAFRQWVQERYQNIEAVNRAWGAVFWSGEMSDFDQIDPRCDRLSWRLAFRRFTDQIQAQRVADQAGCLRAAGADQPITTNVWAGLNPGIDVQQLFTGLDAVGLDMYWNYYADRFYYAAQLDFMRSVAGSDRPLWILETNAWNHDATPDAGSGALRPWAYAVFARGVDTMCYFRWRQSPMGEAHHAAILDWSGEPAGPYRQVQAVCRELDELSNRVGELPMPRRDIAILYDYDTALCAELEARPGFERVAKTHALLNCMHLEADIIPARVSPTRGSIELAGYRLVILPYLEILDDSVQAALENYVRNGGVVLAHTSPGTRDCDGKFFITPEDMGMSSLFGTRVTERCAAIARRPDALSLTSTDDARPIGVATTQASDGRVVQWSATAVQYMEKIEVDAKAQILARYTSGRFIGEPVVSRMPVGQGVSIYQSCGLDESGSRQVLRMSCEAAGINVPSSSTPGLEILRRGKLRFYLNHTDRAVDAPCVAPGRFVVGDDGDGCDGSDQVITLPPWGVCVVDESSSSPKQT